MNPTDDFTDYQKEQVLRVAKHFSVQSDWDPSETAQKLTDLYSACRRLKGNIELLVLAGDLEALFEGEDQGIIGSYADAINKGQISTN